MLSAHIRLALLLTLCAPAQAQLEVRAELGADCSLRCTADPKPGVPYRAVRWYKEGAPPSSRANGLLTKELPDGATRWYTGVRREVQLLAKSRDILLPNVTCGDCGVYSCHLAAPVGEQNREGRVVLALRGCLVEEPSEDLLTDTHLVAVATAVLMLALVVFLVSYFSLRNIIRDRTRTPNKETSLDAALQPLDEKDLQSIYTLGPKVSKSRSMAYACV